MQIPAEATARCSSCGMGTHGLETIRCARCGRVVHAYGCATGVRSDSGQLCDECVEATSTRSGNERWYWEAWS